MLQGFTSGQNRSRLKFHQRSKLIFSISRTPETNFKKCAFTFVFDNLDFPIYFRPEKTRGIYFQQGAGSLVLVWSIMLPILMLIWLILVLIGLI